MLGKTPTHHFILCSDWDQPPSDMIPPGSIYVKVNNCFSSSHMAPTY